MVIENLVDVALETDRDSIADRCKVLWIYSCCDLLFKCPVVALDFSENSESLSMGFLHDRGHRSFMATVGD